MLMKEKVIGSKKMRKSNIELLRILCTLMVISLHMLNPAIIGGIKYAKASGSFLAWGATNWLFCFSITAVDIFILISGYFMIDNDKRKIGKAINLFFVCSVYSVVKYVSLHLANGVPMEVKYLLQNIFPKSYYVFLYCTLYVISPYLNRMVRGMSRQSYRRLIIVGFVLFCLWPTIIDSYKNLTGSKVIEVFTIARDGNGSGFTLINFMYIYLLGGYLKKYPIVFRNAGMKYLELAAALGCSLINCAVTMAVPKLGGTGGLLGYDTALVVIQAAALFDFFTRIDVGSSSVINFVAKSSFGIFLLHTTVIRMIMLVIDVPKMFRGGVLSALGCYFLLLAGSFAAAGLFDVLAHWVMTPVSRWWSKTRLFNFDAASLKE